MLTKFLKLALALNLLVLLSQPSFAQLDTNFFVANSRFETDEVLDYVKYQSGFLIAVKQFENTENQLCLIRLDSNFNELWRNYSFSDPCEDFDFPKIVSNNNHINLLFYDGGLHNVGFNPLNGSVLYSTLTPSNSHPIRLVEVHNNATMSFATGTFIYQTDLNTGAILSSQSTLSYGSSVDFHLAGNNKYLVYKWDSIHLVSRGNIMNKLASIPRTSLPHNLLKKVDWDSNGNLFLFLGSYQSIACLNRTDLSTNWVQNTGITTNPSRLAYTKYNGDIVYVKINGFNYSLVRINQLTGQDSIQQLSNPYPSFLFDLGDFSNILPDSLGSIYVGITNKASTYNKWAVWKLNEQNGLLEYYAQTDSILADSVELFGELKNIDFENGKLSLFGMLGRVEKGNNLLGSAAKVQLDTSNGNNLLTKISASQRLPFASVIDIKSNGNQTFVLKAEGDQAFLECYDDLMNLSWRRLLDSNLRSYPLGLSVSSNEVGALICLPVLVSQGWPALGLIRSDDGKLYTAVNFDLNGQELRRFQIDLEHIIYPENRTYTYEYQLDNSSKNHVVIHSEYDHDVLILELGALGQGQSPMLQYMGEWDHEYPVSILDKSSDTIVVRTDNHVKWYAKSSRDTGSYSFGNQGDGFVHFGDNNLVLTKTFSNYHCYDYKTGALIWQNAALASSANSSLITNKHSNIVYYHGRNASSTDDLLRINGETGTVLNTFSLNDTLLGADPKIITDTTNNIIYVINKPYFSSQACQTYGFVRLFDQNFNHLKSYYLRTEDYGVLETMASHLNQWNELLIGGFTYRKGSGAAGFFHSVKDYSFLGSHDAEQANDESPVTVFPNPSKEQFTIQLKTSSSSNLTVQVMSIHGQLLYQQIHNATVGAPFQLSLKPNLKPGLYLIHVNDGHKTHNQQLIIQ